VLLFLQIGRLDLKLPIGVDFKIISGDGIFIRVSGMIRQLGKRFVRHINPHTHSDSKILELITKK